MFVAISSSNAAAELSQRLRRKVGDKVAYLLTLLFYFQDFALWWKVDLQPYGLKS